ncbi:ankyrin repeat domain-containing protein [Halarcobacter sp.]|uniref:ankyrin repeat domain-containing protein n=1 Tax=Halarcobacter sp. TaxID=2321133 RepID=UPI0029F58F23|nr:ankyrin repeat domain-containing protein [Halarcobacter sp.]
MNSHIKYLIIFLCLVSTLNGFDKGSPLMNAVDQQNFEEIVNLVEKGVDINKKNKLGFTALLYAVGWGDLKTVKYLINKGASLKSRANRGFGVLHRAAMNKNEEIIKYLLENYSFDVNDRGKSYCSPLDFSLRNNALQKNGTLNATKLLLKYGAKKSINWNCNGYTPLMISIKNKEVVDLLINNGADKTIKNKAGFTAYDLAIRENNSKDITEILKMKNYKNERKDIYFIKNLVWELKNNNNRYDKYSKNDAINYCKNLVIQNYNKWRIPTELEYKTILRDEPYTGYIIDGIDKYYFNPKNFPNMVPSRYWIVFKDISLGYQSVSQNFTRKIDDNKKYYIRCVTDKK